MSDEKKAFTVKFLGGGNIGVRLILRIKAGVAILGNDRYYRQIRTSLTRMDIFDVAR